MVRSVASGARWGYPARGALRQWREPCGHDDICADNLVRRAGSVVASGQRGTVLDRRETHESVVDRAAAYSELAEYQR
jgi:hypothetical protein